MLQWHKWETVAEFKACRSKCARYVIRRRYKAGGQRLTNAQRHMIAFEALTVAQGEGGVRLINVDPTRPNEFNTESAAKGACQRAEDDRLAVLKELGKTKPRTILDRKSFTV